MPQKRRVKKIITRSYDEFIPNDYDATVDDNLNPKRKMEYETQVEVLTKALEEKLSVIQGRIKSRQEDLDFDTTSTLSEGGDSGIDAIVNSLVTGGNGLTHKYPGISGPSWLENEIDRALANVIATGSPKLADVFSSFDLSYINCYGVDTLNGGYDYSENDGSDDDDGSGDGDNNGLDADSASGNNNGDDNDGSNGNDPPWDINYVVDNGTNASANPTTYEAAFLPLYIEAPTADAGYTFKGWYYDSGYSSKVSSNVIVSGKTGDLTLYAKLVSDEDSDGDDDEDENGWGDDADNDDNDDLDEAEYEEACDIADLLILKIIAIIVRIIAILIKIISLVLGILIPLSELLPFAIICWICPPALQKIINYLMQTAMAMVMQIIGVILQKLWSMLNLECISDAAMSLIDQIQSALSGITGIMTSISDAAADLSSGFDLATQIKESISQAIDSAKEELKKLTPSNVLKDAKKSAADSKNALKSGFSDIVDTFKDPDTYLDLMPDDAKETIEGLVSSVKSTAQMAKSIQKAASSMVRAFSGVGSSAKAAIDSFKAKN